MQKRYDGLELILEIEHTRFRVLDIVFEHYDKPIPMHSHGQGCYEIHYIPSGCGSVVLAGTRHELTPGFIYVTGPGIEHEQFTDPENPMEEYGIFLKAEEDHRQPPEAPGIISAFLDTPLWIGHDTQNMLPLIKALFRELKQANTGYMIMAESLLKQCMISLIRNYRMASPETADDAPASLPDDRKSIIIDECFLYEYNTLTLETLAARLSLSVRQTQRFIEKQYHQSFRQKRTAARMHAAKTMLVSTQLPITTISDMVGYTSVEHFSRAFREYAGCSPMSYRKKPGA